MIKVRTEVKDI